MTGLFRRSKGTIIGECSEETWRVRRDSSYERVFTSDVGDRANGVAATWVGKSGQARTAY